MRAPLITLLLRLLALLPLPLAHAAGAGLGWLAWVIPNRARRVTLTNLALCLPERDEDERRALARRSLIETGKTVTEMGAMWFWPPRRVKTAVRGVRGKEVLQAGLNRGRGIILLTAHLGAWELVSLYLVQELALTCLYRPPRIEGLEATILRSRERTGARLVPTTPSGVKRLYQALARGEVVGILPDQDPGRGAGVFAPFFGVAANTMVLVPRLARATGATVVFLYAERLPRGRGYAMRFREAPEGIDDADPAVAAAAMNLGVEACVRECLAQYQWSYKRFKTRPQGEGKLY
ncbi:MAG: lysophospholipid acyltransferase family protein [Gammaproteobacteria bacterium]|nr:lysophospholipid acyltransferase family protein [Gammaproteobacteria bacterium]NIR98373.1 lysophospholipid acyltransferase family protein [Gammaproteobacteria bacterium]NIT64127.1 lysophospholipid acyltransferase family protein [Gammaproteobacteria bacterium]NIV21064.1 lipid A biosynthesis acyltransferase [Gammaproteobacteria bacterium]NIY32707.1 lipid A biosynthesis acyltransferase [Gammaproteobacteria bacterium]